MQLPVTADVGFLVQLWRDIAPLGFVATCGFLWKVNTRLTRIETVLTGANGTNGLNGEVKTLRSRMHQLANAVQTVLSRVAVLESKTEDK